MHKKKISHIVVLGIILVTWLQAKIKVSKLPVICFFYHFEIERKIGNCKKTKQKKTTCYPFFQFVCQMLFHFVLFFGFGLIWRNDWLKDAQIHWGWSVFYSCSQWKCSTSGHIMLLSHCNKENNVKLEDIHKGEASQIVDSASCICCEVAANHLFRATWSKSEVNKQWICPPFYSASPFSVSVNENTLFWSSVMSQRARLPLPRWWPHSSTCTSVNTGLNMMVFG